MLKFSSPQFELKMTRLAQAVTGGILIPLALYLAIILTDPGDSESVTPLLERHPLAWLIGWPSPIAALLFPFPKEVRGLFVAGCNGIAWTSLTYALLRSRVSPKQLP